MSTVNSRDSSGTCAVAVQWPHNPALLPFVQPYVVTRCMHWLLTLFAEGFLDDVERAVNNGVNAFKGLTRDTRAVPGGLAVLG